MTPSEARLRIACGQVQARDLAAAPEALADALEVVARAGTAGAQLCILPEATYPAYVLGSSEAARATIAMGPDPVAAFCDAARDAGCAVVVGLVLEGPHGLENAAVLIDVEGVVRARAAKRFLWHFDREWFAPGGAGSLHDGIGMLVCADARLPEIGLDLAARGARVIANPTAWVTSMPPPAGTNSQAEFLWRVRALENGVVAAAATKVGAEADTVIYAGRSQIVGPDGTVLAIGSADRPELVIAEVELPAAPACATLTPPNDDAAHGAWNRPPLRAGFLQVALLTDDDLLARLDGHSVDVVVGPSGVLRGGDVALRSFCDDELVDPRPARAAARAAAELLVWHARRVSTALVEEVARTRALENRVFVLVWRSASAGGPFVVDPAGAVIARAGADRFAVQASCLRAAAATKVMAPGTDAFDAGAGLRAEIPDARPGP